MRSKRCPKGALSLALALFTTICWSAEKEDKSFLDDPACRVLAHSYPNLDVLDDMIESRNLARVHVLKCDGSSSEILPITYPARLAAPSPNGRWIAFLKEAYGGPHLYVVDNETGKFTRLGTVSGIYSYSWSPNSRYIATVGRGGLYIVSVDGKVQRRLDANIYPESEASWSSDSYRLVYEERCGCTLSIVNLNGSIRKLDPAPGDCEQWPIWSPRGDKIAYVSNIHNDKRRFSADDHWDTPGRAVYVVDVDGSNPTRLTHPDRDAIRPSWAPDGQSIAFHYIGFLFDDQINVVNINDSNDRVVIPKARFYDTVKWSPDGKWLLYEDRGIYAVSVDGKHTVTISTEQHFSSPEWFRVSGNTKIQ